VHALLSITTINTAQMTANRRPGRFDGSRANGGNQRRSAFSLGGQHAKNCSPWSRYGKPKITSIDEAGGVFQNPAVTPDATPTYCFPFEA